MIKVKFVGNLRGFFKHLVNIPPTGIEYVTDSNTNFYEKNSKIKNTFKKIGRSKIADNLGVIKSIDVQGDNFDIIQSYNRFVRTNKPYLISLENPTALYHYSLDRRKTILGSKNLKSKLNDNSLKYIVCISKACYQNIHELLNLEIPDYVKIKQIYPLIPINKYIDEEKIKEMSFKKNIKCLFVSSTFKLKGGVELLEVFNDFSDNVKLTIITDINSLEQKTLNTINSNKNITLIDFNFNYEELEKIYSDHDILVHPTRQDSYSLVVLEAMKAGMALIGTELYAIPEMIENGHNGYLIPCKYYFFDSDNMPNEYVWKNRAKTIYSDYIDYRVIEAIKNSIIELNTDREKLYKYRMNSFKKANIGEFSEQYIKAQWQEVYQDIDIRK